MQLAGCVWRKRRFLFTHLTVVWQPPYTCRHIITDSRQIVNPALVFSSVHESTVWATLRVCAFHLLCEKMFQFFHQMKKTLPPPRAIDMQYPAFWLMEKKICINTGIRSL